MSVGSYSAPRATALGRLRGRGDRGYLGLGVSTLYLSVIVLIPLAAVVAKAFSSGTGTFFDSVTNSVELGALGTTLLASLIVAAIGAVMGTLVAWVQVRAGTPASAWSTA